MGASAVKSEFPPLLLAGFYPMTTVELRAACVARFPHSLSRRGIMEGLEEVIRRLSGAAIVGEVWVDGSFVTKKIDPEDVDILVRVSSDQYDNDAAKRAVVDWASHPDLWDTHSCDAYKWIEFTVSHPLFADSETMRDYWTNWYGHSRKGTPKGIIVVILPAAIS